MADTHDTIDGLLAEFRGYSAGMPASYHVTMSWADFRKMLDRLEKANKRERGNSAALRNALNLCVDEMCARCRDLAKARGNPAPCLNGCEPVRKAKAALAAPPRNCDVGTAEEQAKRLNEWCNGRHCINCRFKGGWPDECKLKWAQMPYEEGGAK